MALAGWAARLMQETSTKVIASETLWSDMELLAVQLCSRQCSKRFVKPVMRLGEMNGLREGNRRSSANCLFVSRYEKIQVSRIQLSYEWAQRHSGLEVSNVWNKKGINYQNMSSLVRICMFWWRWIEFDLFQVPTFSPFPSLNCMFFFFLSSANILLPSPFAFFFFLFYTISWREFFLRGEWGFNTSLFALSVLVISLTLPRKAIYSFLSENNNAFGNYLFRESLYNIFKG